MNLEFNYQLELQNILFASDLRNIQVIHSTKFVYYSNSFHPLLFEDSYYNLKIKAMISYSFFDYDNSLSAD